MHIQYGAGLSAPDGWQNFDSSPTLRVERLPVIRLFLKRSNRLFPENVQFGDIVRGLPVKDGTADGVYASHVLEHLSRRDFEIALENTFRMLKPRGIFRLIVPDLETRARTYLQMLNESTCEANDWFMTVSGLGANTRPGALRRITESLGGTRHLWMWDWPSMRGALEKVGFSDIRRCAFGDCEDKRFSDVEDYGRFYDGNHKIDELAVEAKKSAHALNSFVTK
jgi:SAM-dependent methyltransferase